MGVADDRDARTVRFLARVPAFAGVINRDVELDTLKRAGAGEGAVEQVIWRPDSAGLFVDIYPRGDPLNSHHLYTYDLEEWELQLVDLDFRGDYFWAILAESNP